MCWRQCRQCAAQLCTAGNAVAGGAGHASQPSHPDAVGGIREQRHQRVVRAGKRGLEHAGHPAGREVCRWAEGGGLAEGDRRAVRGRRRRWVGRLHGPACAAGTAQLAPSRVAARPQGGPTWDRGWVQAWRRQTAPAHCRWRDHAHSAPAARRVRPPASSRPILGTLCSRPQGAVERVK